MAAAAAASAAAASNNATPRAASPVSWAIASGCGQRLGAEGGGHRRRRRRLGGERALQPLPALGAVTAKEPETVQRHGQAEDGSAGPAAASQPSAARRLACSASSRSRNRLVHPHLADSAAPLRQREEKGRVRLPDHVLLAAGGQAV